MRNLPLTDQTKIEKMYTVVLQSFDTPVLQFLIRDSQQPQY